jgi:hypothetical protein
VTLAKGHESENRHPSSKMIPWATSHWFPW